MVDYQRVVRATKVKEHGLSCYGLALQGPSWQKREALWFRLMAWTQHLLGSREQPLHINVEQSNCCKRPRDL